MAEAMMDEIIVGYGNRDTVMDLHLERRGSYRPRPLPPNARGIWTAGISDCMVVCAAYYDAAQHIWGRFWFQHVQGGQYDKIVQSIEIDLDEDTVCTDVGNRYAVIASGNDIGVKFIAADLDKIGIPLNNITSYISGTGNRGFAFGVNFSTGLFGEVAGNGMELPAT
jgi:hypothetical protein